MVWTALAAPADVVAASGWVWRHRPHAAPPPSLAAAPSPSRAPIVAPADRVLFGGAELAYSADTRVRFRAADNEIAVDAGTIEVRAASLVRPLNLDARRFRVILRHAHVIIAADAVRVLDGSVEIYTHDAQPLAIVGAGADWHPSDAPAHRATRKPSDSDGSALDAARAALARGDGSAARAILRRAQSPSVRAQAELFRAESWLVDGNADRAIAAYDDVARAFPSSSAGESAAFAAAELLVERGRKDDADRALRRYLAQYPDGRFAREARERLGDLRPVQ
jgi:tetratricopeptide (TPR) repeat protein